MIATLWLLAALQGPRLTIAASVDRIRLAVGEVLVLTLRAQTTGPPPVWTLPSFAGFALVATHEVTDVSVRAAPGLRSTVRELTLRATRPGTLVIGPVRVRQGTQVATTKSITVSVARSAGRAAVLAAPARALLDAAPAPPRGDQVSLSVLLRSDSVPLGAQLDLLVVAWFPRDLRLRLRVQPVLTLPPAVGVWAYPEERPDEPVAERLVQGHWMDAYVVHSTVFPLEAGALLIPAATVDYSVPVSFSIFSREERYSLRSDSTVITVVAPPGVRPADDRDVAGHRLALGVSVTPLDTRVGEPLAARTTVSGIGNVTLWPEPVLRWPSGFRSYAAATTVSVEPDQGRIAGTKTFEYFVVPDSTGTFVLPEVRYPYYDLAARGYVVVRAPPQTLSVLAGAEPRVVRGVPPLEQARTAWADALARGPDQTGWAALGGLPPLVGLLVLRRRRRAPEPMVKGPPLAPSSPLGRLERDFHAVLASQVPDPSTRDGDGLARALRAAGLERAVADHVMRLRDRLRAARYGPRGQGDVAELVAELAQVLKVLGADAPRTRARRGGLLVLGIALGVTSVHAQAPPEVLYQAGALRPAADSFAARAMAEPDVAAHWYNLGAALYRAGADGKAVVAWTKAARLAPRDPAVAHARTLLPAPDAATDQLLAVAPLTPGEGAVLVAGAWFLVWAAVLTGRRRLALVALLICAAALGGWAKESWRRSRPLAVILRPATPVRVAPYGSAGITTSVDAGAALVVDRQEGRWLAVHRDDGVEGWVFTADVVRL